MSAEKICKFAKKLKVRRGETCLCFKDNTEKEMLVFVNFPDKISNIPSCVAANEFSTGHATPDSYIEIRKMYECGNRKEE